MVTWQTLVSIAFDIAQEKGAEFQNIEDGGGFLSDLSSVWEQDKDRLKQMTEQQARDYLQDLVEA